jgi:hypothetical protein
MNISRRVHHMSSTNPITRMTFSQTDIAQYHHNVDSSSNMAQQSSRDSYDIFPWSNVDK